MLPTPAPINDRTNPTISALDGNTPAFSLGYTDYLEGL